MRNWFLILTALLFFSVRSVFATVTTDISGYCKDGYYQIPGEQVCSRAPYCGGYEYDELNVESKMKNYNSCMGDGDGREERGCAGYVPLCCYEMARTGQYTKCIGYWERLWCSQDLCTEAKENGANDNQCPGGCGGCAHASNSYCGKITSVPIEQRLGIAAPSPTPRPTATPTPAASMPTSTPTLGVTPGVTSPVPTSTTIPTRTPTQTPTQAPMVTIPFGNQTYNAPPPYISPTPLSLMPITTLSELNLSQVGTNIKIIRSHIEPEQVVKVTMVVFDAPKKVTKTIQSADIELEATIDSWWLLLINRIQTYLQ